MESASFKKHLAITLVAVGCWCVIFHVQGQTCVSGGSLTSTPSGDVCFSTTTTTAQTIQQPASTSRSTGVSINYLWYYSTDGINYSFVPRFSGGKDLMIPPNDSRYWGERHYTRATLANFTGCLTEGPIIVRTYVKPDITMPANTTFAACAGQSVTLAPQTVGYPASMTGAASAFTLDYQWEMSPQNNGTWAPIASTDAAFGGQQTMSLTITNVNNITSGAGFRCLVTVHGSTSCVSESGVFTVNTTSLNVTNLSRSVCADAMSGSASVDLTSYNQDVASGATGRVVEWFSDPSTTSTVSAPNNYVVNAQSTDVYARVTDPATSCSGVATVTITKNFGPLVSTASTALATCSGVAVDVTELSVGSTTATFQWQVYDATNNAWTNVAGPDFSNENADALHINSPDSYNASRFRCVVTESGCETLSDEITLTVTSPPQVTVSNTEVAGCEGQGAKMKVSATSTTTSTSPITYQWQRQDVAGTWTNIAGDLNLTNEQTDELTVGNVTNYAGAYRCVVSQDGCEATSVAFTLSVDSPVTLSSQTMEVCEDPLSPNQGVADVTSLHATLASPSPVSDFSFQWYEDQALNTTVTNPAQVMVAVGTPLTLYVEVSRGGCNASAPVVITANALPNITMPAQTLITACAGSSANFTLASVMPTVSTIYQWEQSVGLNMVGNCRWHHRVLWRIEQFASIQQHSSKSWSAFSMSRDTGKLWQLLGRLFAAGKQFANREHGFDAGVRRYFAADRRRSVGQSDTTQQRGNR